MMAKRWKMFFRFFEMGLEKGVNHIIIPSKVNFGKKQFHLTDIDDKHNSTDQNIYQQEPVMPSKNDFAKF